MPWFVCVCVCVSLYNLIQRIDLRNHHHNQDTELFHLHKVTPLCYPFIVPPVFSPPCHCPTATSNLFSNSIILSFGKCNINGIIQYITSEIGFIPKAQCPCDPSKLVPVFIPFYCWVVFHWMDRLECVFRFLFLTSVLQYNCFTMLC